jgi:hypothetical protein
LRKAAPYSGTDCTTDSVTWGERPQRPIRVGSAGQEPAEILSIFGRPGEQY